MTHLILVIAIECRDMLSYSEHLWFDLNLFECQTAQGTTTIEINAMHDLNVSRYDIQDRAHDMEMCLRVMWAMRCQLIAWVLRLDHGTQLLAYYLRNTM
jgi:hypothetical protein